MQVKILRCAQNDSDEIVSLPTEKRPRTPVCSAFAGAAYMNGFYCSMNSDGTRTNFARLSAVPESAGDTGTPSVVTLSIAT